MRHLSLIAALLALAGGTAVGGVGSATAAPTYELLSVNSRERPANDRTYEVDVAGTGRYVVFSSAGRNLSSQDSTTNEAATDIYLRDRRAGTTRLVSRATSGRAATGSSPSISPNGRFVAFCSLDPFIVKPDSLDLVGWERDLDVFVRDLRTGVTRRASTDRKGKEADNASCAPNVADNGDTVFASLATDLVKRDIANQGHDTFLYDWSSRRVRYVGTGWATQEGAAISGNARYLAFIEGLRRVGADENPGLDVYVLDRRTNRLRVATDLAIGGPLAIGCDPWIDLSYGGRFLLVSCRDGAIVDPPVADAYSHLVVIDRLRDRRWLVNPSTVVDPVPDQVDMSDDGRTVAFVGQVGSYGGLPGDDQAVYVWRHGEGLLNLTPGADDTWSLPGLAVSGDGSFVAFTTDSRTISDQDPEDPIDGPPQADLYGVEVP